MLKCAIFADFIDFENGCCYLKQLHTREENKHGFLAFMFKNIHYFICFNTPLFYIRMVMEEKLC